MRRWQCGTRARAKQKGLRSEDVTHLCWASRPQSRICLSYTAASSFGPVSVHFDISYETRTTSGSTLTSGLHDTTWPLTFCDLKRDAFRPGISGGHWSAVVGYSSEARADGGRRRRCRRQGQFVASTKVRTHLIRDTQ